jgi:Flp pilus assembly protein TadB
MISRRSGSAADKAMEKRLSEATGMARPCPRGRSVARSGWKPPGNSNRPHARRSADRPWNDGSNSPGTNISVSGCLLISLGLAILGALLAAMFIRTTWAMAIAFAVGLSIMPLYVRQKRSARLYKFEEYFPEALDLLSRGIRAGTLPSVRA